MAIGSSWLTVVTDSVFDGTANGDVTSATVAGQIHDLTGAMSAHVLLHADNQAGTPVDDIRFDVYQGSHDGSTSELEITPSDSVALNLVSGSSGVDPNSKQITLFPVPHYLQVKATRVNAGAGVDTIRCRVRIEKQQSNPNA